MSTADRASPRERIAAEVAARGLPGFVAGCVELAGVADGEIPDPDLDLLRALAGPGAGKFFDGREHVDTYWFRVWALRGLLWAYDGAAEDCLTAAVGDPAWRVREMAAKVVARHRVVEAQPAMAALLEDPVPRVRRAAERALQRTSEVSGR